MFVCVCRSWVLSYEGGTPVEIAVYVEGMGLTVSAGTGLAWGWCFWFLGNG